MSATINGTTIKLTRGDTMYLQVSILDDAGDPYVPEATDAVRFAVKRTDLNRFGTEFVDEEPLVLKDMTYDSEEGVWTLHLVPGDTALLGFGNYRYDIQLSTNYDAEAEENTDDYTVVADAKLKLTPEVD